MSAECSTCGTDLVFMGDWSEMRCERCDLRAEVTRLKAENKRLRIEEASRNVPLSFLEDAEPDDHVPLSFKEPQHD